MRCLKARQLPSGKGASLQHTILVVDDDRENLKFLKSLLESRGHSVHQAPNAQFAASLIHKNVGRYSLAIVDYHMPGMMGDEATKLFQEIDRDLQVITISGDFKTPLRPSQGIPGTQPSPPRVICRAPKPLH